VRSPRRDRCGHGLALLCAALVILALPAAALEATFRVDPPGDGAKPASRWRRARKYFFWDFGLAGREDPENGGECLPDRDCTNCSFTFKEDIPHHLPGGQLHGALRIRALRQPPVSSFPEPYNVTVFLPAGLDIRNPLAGGHEPARRIPSMRRTGESLPPGTGPVALTSGSTMRPRGPCSSSSGRSG